MSLNKNYYSIQNTKINHGFFNRLNGFSKKEFKSLNCSLSNGDNKKLVYKNRLKALRQLKLHKKKLILINQIHSSKVIQITKSNLNKKIEADGIITSLTNVVLGILTADCAPIFIYDNKARFVCCLHSGWKGALKNIAAKGIEYFVKQKIIEKNIVVLIGPCLSFKNFEVSKDFKSKFISKNKKYSIFFKYKNKDKDLFNLRRLINYQFKELGIKNIYNINKDTFSNKRVFFSHRRESQKFRYTGRMLNIIAFDD